MFGVVSKFLFFNCGDYVCQRAETHCSIISCNPFGMRARGVGLSLANMQVANGVGGGWQPLKRCAVQLLILRILPMLCCSSTKPRIPPILEKMS